MSRHNAEESRRKRVVHGWAFREHTDKEKAAIRTYIATGIVTDDLPESYKELNEIM